MRLQQHSFAETDRLPFSKEFLPGDGNVAIISPRRQRHDFNLNLRSHIIKTASGGPLEKEADDGLD